MFAANLTLLLTAFFSPPSLVEGKQQKPLHTQPASLLDADFDVLVKESLERWHVPGMAISIVDDGVISAKVYLPFLLSTPTRSISSHICNRLHDPFCKVDSL